MFVIIITKYMFIEIIVFALLGVFRFFVSD